MMGRHANRFELQSIAHRKVDVPFYIAPTDLWHLEAGLCKGLKLSCELQVPSAIKNTIGHKRTPRSAIWRFSADNAAAPIFKTLPPVYVEW